MQVVNDEIDVWVEHDEIDVIQLWCSSAKTHHFKSNYGAVWPKHITLNPTMEL